MADYPAPGSPNWDGPLKAYIDDADLAVGASITDAVAQAVEDQASGIELGYAERLTSFTATDTAAITGLSVSVTGRGRPVDVEFFCANVSHSVPGTWVQAVLIEGVGNQIGGGGDLTADATFGRLVIVKRRLVLTEDVEYTFLVNTTMNAAGTSTWFASATRPMSLSVVSR